MIGDGRRYDWVIALRAVETIDFMTAHWAHLPYDFLDVCSRRIINEVKGISRVVYDISRQAAGDDRVGVTRRRPEEFVIRILLILVALICGGMRDRPAAPTRKPSRR